jgi:hypothetical protein
VRAKLQELRKEVPHATPPGHRAAVKKTIIGSAPKLLNRHAFENVAPNQIMAGEGPRPRRFLWRSQTQKRSLTEILNCFYTDPNWKNC